MKLHQKIFKLILYKVHRLLVRGLLKKKCIGIMFELYIYIIERCERKGGTRGRIERTEGILQARPAHTANPERWPIPLPVGCEMSER